jgi:hypothetical protein
LYICIEHKAIKIMEPQKEEIPNDIPKFLRKIIQDKRDIKDALKNKKPLSDLAKEKDIKFAKLL